MMMVRKSKGLSDRHYKIMSLLQEYAENEGYPPSIREIGERTGITSTSVVNYYLEQLEKWGYIERDRRISRGLRVVPEKLAELGNVLRSAATAAVNEFMHVPVIGRIGASLPMPVPASDFRMYDDYDGVDIARSMLPTKKTENLFALEVKGDSMIDAMVNDGDIGGIVGLHFREELQLEAPIISIDGIALSDFDYIDIGALIPSSGAVPVVIKSLIFPTAPQN